MNKAGVQNKSEPQRLLTRSFSKEVARGISSWNSFKEDRTNSKIVFGSMPPPLSYVVLPRCEGHVSL